MAYGDIGPYPVPVRPLPPDMLNRFERERRRCGLESRPFVCEVVGCGEDAEGKAIRTYGANPHVCRAHWREWYKAAGMPARVGVGPGGIDLSEQACLALLWGWGR